MALHGAQPPRLPVLTYNIHHGEGTDGKFDYERLAQVITGLQPDVVALQEVDRNTCREGVLNSVGGYAAVLRPDSVRIGLEQLIEK